MTSDICKNISRHLPLSRSPPTSAFGTMNNMSRGDEYDTLVRSRDARTESVESGIGLTNEASFDDNDVDYNNYAIDDRDKNNADASDVYDKATYNVNDRATTLPADADGDDYNKANYKINDAYTSMSDLSQSHHQQPHNKNPLSHNYQGQQQQQDAYEDLEQYEKMSPSQQPAPIAAQQPKHNGRRRNTNDALTPMTSFQTCHDDRQITSQAANQQRQQQPPSTLIAMHNLGQQHQQQKQQESPPQQSYSYVGIDEYRNPLYSSLPENESGRENTRNTSTTRRPAPATDYGTKRGGEIPCNVPYTIPSRYSEDYPLSRPSYHPNTLPPTSTSSQKKRNLLYESTTTTELLQRSRIDGVGPNNNKISITKQNSTSTLTVCQEQDDDEGLCI